jgi:hypothetical protein
MRSVVAWIVGVAALSLGACDPIQDYNYYTQGIGTNISSPTIAADTQLQDEYLSDLCEEAGLAEAPCMPAVSSRNWGLVVQAGMNDIDQRCDAFLGWLDEKRRNQEPILNELQLTSAATQSIMNFAGVGANPITIVGLAFGLASNTFTNVRSSLLLEVDKSTVETIVINGQNKYRQGLQSQIVDNRAAAVYALRSYLRICTPFTIANQINTTVTLFERGAGAAIDQTPMVNPKLVRSATIQSATAALPTNWRPPAADIQASFDAAVDATLCVAQTQESRDAAIRDYFIGGKKIDPAATTYTMTRPLQAFLQRAVDMVPACRGAGYLDAYEVGLFGVAPAAQRSANIKLLQANLRLLLNKSATDLPSSGVLDAATRSAIAEARTKLNLDPELKGAIDLQFWAKINA